MQNIYYPPFQYQSQYMQQAPNNAPQNNSNNIIWVQGEAGAKSFHVAPNTTVTLWDSENQTIYLKSADSSGMPSMKILDYEIRERETVQKPLVEPMIDYATKEDLEAVKKEIRDEITKLTKKEKGA